MKIFTRPSFSLALAFTTLTLAQSLLADDALVLPEGRWRLRWASAYSQADTKFGSNDLTQSLGSPFSRALTGSFLSQLGLAPGLSDYAQKKNQFKSGSGDEFMAATIATLNSNISAEIYSNILAAEYGVTSKLSVGFILPIIYGRTEFDGSISSNDAFKAVAATLPTAVQERLTPLQSLSTINQILKQQYGYTAALQSWSGSGLGDLEVGGKYQYFKNAQVRATAKAGVRLPTGRQDDPDELLDLAFGDGQTDLGFYSLIDYDLIPEITFTWEAGYNVQLPHEVDIRIPVSADLPLGANKITVDHTPGDFWESAWEANISPISRVTFSPRYRFKQKFADEYDSPAATVLEANTSQILHEGQVQLEYSNLKAVKAGTEHIPFSIAAFYKLNFAGKNTSDFRTAGLQLKTYF